MKFKVGDRVKIVKCGVKKLDKKNKKGGFVLGLEGTIINTYLFDEKSVDIEWDNGKVTEEWHNDGDLKKIGKKANPLFVVIYDEVSGDPTKVIETEKELFKWLEEAKRDPQIVFSSIKIYRISGVLRPEIDFRLVEE